MERFDCCAVWDYCCAEGKCVCPETLEQYDCTTAEHLSRGINYLKKGELLLIDGNSFLHRCFHAFPFMTSPAGLPTNAVFGTMKMLEGLVGEFSPTHLAVCFDASKHTLRHKQYPQYKANRNPTPQQLVRQFVIIREVLSALNIAYFEHVEYEADDLLGTIAQKAVGYLTRIATSDRDCIQLIDHRTRLILYKNGSHPEVKLQDVMDEYGIEPWQMVHYKALAGDKSDNIPGVPGIGEKTALELVKKFGSIRQIAEAAGEVPGRIGKLLVDGSDSMKLSYDLAKINCECPIEVDFDKLKLNADLEKGEKKLATLGIKKINLGVFVVKEGKKEAMPDRPVEKTAQKVRKGSPQYSEVNQLSLF